MLSLAGSTLCCLRMVVILVRCSVERLAPAPAAAPCPVVEALPFTDWLDCCDAPDLVSLLTAAPLLVWALPDAPELWPVVSCLSPAFISDFSDAVMPALPLSPAFGSDAVSGLAAC